MDVEEDVFVSGLSLDDGKEVVTFPGKKKPSKKKNSKSVNVVDEPEQPLMSVITKEADIHEPSKNKKKKKKGGRTAQEEDDLEKILTELGEAHALIPTSAATIEPIQAEKVEPHADESGEKGETEGVVESAAAKKKKKKKEKEKEKEKSGAKTATTAEAEEKKGIVKKGSETCQKFARETCKAKGDGGIERMKEVEEEKQKYVTAN